MRSYGGAVPPPSVPPTIPAALAAALRTDPGRPLVTFYDDATGERVELSVKTFDNWVSKIANLFSDELMLEPGDRVAIDLPTHWLSPVTAVAAWVAGLVVVLRPPGETSAAAVHVVGADALSHAHALTGRVVACSLRPLGGRFIEPLPQGWLDFALEVPAQPDVVLTPAPTSPDTAALDDGEQLLTQADLVEGGVGGAGVLELQAGGRLATDLNPMTTDGLVAALLAPLVTGASLVLVVKADGMRREVIASQERVTCQLWSDA